MEETIKNIIDNSELNIAQKSRLKGLLDRSYEDRVKHNADLELIEKIAKCSKIQEIILSYDDVIIYTVYGKQDWDKKYPFRVIYRDKDNKWNSCYTVCPNMDTALLVYLEQKYIGLNSQFSDFAMKMLGINIS